ncbi:MAG: hypothetical protein ACK5O2_06630 [Microthrixaceae bacterium]
MTEDEQPTEAAGGQPDAVPDAPVDPVGTQVDPSDAPAPRPDPYAQFGNPLHDTWGTKSPPVEPPAPVVPPVKSRKSSRAAKTGKRSSALPWVLTVVVIGALAAAGWLLRDSLADAWDWVTDRVADGSDPTTTTSADEAINEAVENQTAEFENWLDTRTNDVELLGQGTLEISAALVRVGESATSTAGTDPTVLRSALDPLRSSILAKTSFLNGAPTSPVRNDFVNGMLVSVDSINATTAALDSGVPAELDRAGDRLVDSGEELERLCRLYESSAGKLC